LIFQPTQDGKPAAPGLDSGLPFSDGSGNPADLTLPETRQIKLSCIKISSQIIFLSAAATATTA